MYQEITQNNDTLNVASDSLAAVKETAEMNKVTFDIFNIGSEGIIISILGYTIVFIALVFLFLLFSYLTKFLHFHNRRKLRAAGHQAAEKDLHIPGEITAAISTAIILHFREVHDFEDTVITIKKVQKTYSPWSSKIYGLRQTPNRK